MKQKFVVVFMFLIAQVSSLGMQRVIIVDDYEANSNFRDWTSSRIGTNRYDIKSDYNSVVFQDSVVHVTVYDQFGWAGVLTSLIHEDTDCTANNSMIDPKRLLGDIIHDDFQARLIAVEIELLDGDGMLKVELKDCSNTMIFESIQPISGSGVVCFDVNPDELDRVKILNWIVHHQGYAVVSEVRLIVDIPDMNWQTAGFLFSYAQLLQTFDPESGFVRDRTEWPVKDFAAVQSMGTVALSTALASKLRFVRHHEASNIIQSIKDAILYDLPRCNGLLPHFVEYNEIHSEWQIVPDDNDPDKTEWSTIDTLIAAIGTLLACQIIGIETSELENLVSEIDWDRLTSNNSFPVSHGYAFSCPVEPLETRWDTFGSESFLVALTYAAANEEIPLITYVEPITWNGSGFIDEMAALFFPMTGFDYWNNDWSEFRSNAFSDQRNYFNQYPDTPYLPYTELELFGVSATEVPEPWLFDEEIIIYHGWGIGGRIPADDGFSMMGYPILAPHYVSMVSKEFPDESEQVFTYLMAHNIFSPMNQVESFGICEENQNRWNALKGSWDLSLQSLGFARLLSEASYATYMALAENNYLRNGYNHVMLTQIPEPECIHHGDVNFDGNITAGDAQLAFEIVLGSYYPSFTERCAADCNADDNVTAADAQQIFQTALGLASCMDPVTTPTPTPSPTPDYLSLRLECECFDRQLGGQRVVSPYASGQDTGCVLADTWGGQNPGHEPIQTEYAEYDNIVIPYDVPELKVQIRYSDSFDSVNESNLVLIKFDGIQKGSFFSENTGNSWDDYDCMIISLGYIAAGTYTIRIESNGGYWNAINMDYMFFHDSRIEEPTCGKYYTGCPCSRDVNCINHL